MQSINDLNSAWIAAGQAVEDKQSHVQAMATQLVAEPNKYSNEELEAAKAELDSAVVARDFAKDALETAKDNTVTAMDNSIKEKLNDENGHKKFANSVRDLMAGKVKVLNLVTSSPDNTKGSGAGLTIPEDIQTRINTLIRQYDTLQPLVNTESVSTTSGSRVVEQFSLMTSLQNIDDEDAVIGDNDEPKLKTITYKIQRYAGINKITDSLIKDSDEAIITWITTWIAKKVVVTRNMAIISVLNKAPKKATITKFDDIKDITTTQLDPAINALGTFVTNVSGLSVLNKVKDAMGNYLLQKDPTKADGYMLDGKSVVVVSDNWLPDVSGNHPLYFGAFKEAVTVFDRENLSLATTTEGGDSFAKDQTWIRVIDRFDTELVDDEAITVGSFSTIADQSANFTAAPASK